MHTRPPKRDPLPHLLTNYKIKTLVVFLSVCLTVCLTTPTCRKELLFCSAVCNFDPRLRSSADSTWPRTRLATDRVTPHPRGSEELGSIRPVLSRSYETSSQASSRSRSFCIPPSSPLCPRFFREHFFPPETPQRPTRPSACKQCGGKRWLVESKKTITRTSSCAALHRASSSFRGGALHRIGKRSATLAQLAGTREAFVLEEGDREYQTTAKVHFCFFRVSSPVLRDDSSQREERSLLVSRSRRRTRGTPTLQGIPTPILPDPYTQWKWTALVRAHACVRGRPQLPSPSQQSERRSGRAQPPLQRGRRGVRIASGGAREPRLLLHRRRPKRRPALPQAPARHTPGAMGLAL